jgi:hypothetical protein
MLQVGPDNTLFSKEPKITVQQAEAFVTALNEKLLPSDQTQHLFSDFKARFDELKRELNNSLNELNANLVQLRNDLWDSLVSAYGGRVPRKWPRVDASAAESQFEFMDNTRDLMFMLMGLSLGRLFRAKLPPELQTLPESMSLDVFKAKVFDFAVAVPFEEMYRGLVAQSLMSELVIRTVMKEPMVFDLSRNFTWNEREKKGTAVYSFQEDLQSWPFSLVANSGVKFGKLPVKLRAPESPGPVCGSCMRTNSEEVGITFRPELDVFRSLAFEDEILHKMAQPLAVLSFVSQSREDNYQFRIHTRSDLSQPKQELLQSLLRAQGQPEEEEEEEEGKGEHRAEINAAVEWLRHQYDDEYDHFVKSPDVLIRQAKIVDKAFDLFFDGNVTEALTELGTIDGPEIAELKTALQKFPAETSSENVAAAFKSTMKKLLEQEYAIRTFDHATALLELEDYLRKPIQLQIGNAKAADQFIGTLRDVLQGRGLPTTPDVWSTFAEPRCTQPREKYTVWVFSQLLMLSLQEAEHADNDRKLVLFNRFMKLKAAGYLSSTRSLQMFEDVETVEQLFQRISEQKARFVFTTADNLCFTSEQHTGETEQKEEPVPVPVAVGADRAIVDLELRYQDDLTQSKFSIGNLKSAIEIKKAKIVYLDGDIEQARASILRQTGRSELQALVDKAKKQVLTLTEGDFDQVIRALLQEETGIRAVEDIPLLLNVYDYFSKPVQPMLVTAQDGQQFLGVLRKFVQTSRAYTAPWLSTENSSCVDKRKEKLMLWIFSQLIAYAWQEAKKPNETRKTELYRRFQLLQQTDYIKTTPQVAQFQTVNSVNQLFSMLEPIDAFSFKFHTSENLCFT